MIKLKEKCYTFGVKKIFLVLLGLLIVSLMIFGFLFFKKETSPASNTLFFNQTTGKWENVNNVPRIEIEHLDENPNEDGLHNLAILRGYFDHYDKEKDEIVIKAMLPFTGELQYKLTNIKTPPQKIIYCSPSTIVDGQTGESLQTKNLSYIVKNNEEMKIYKESIINFDEFVTKATEKTYLFIQLTKNLDKTQDNYAQKIVVIGLCD